MIPVVVILGLLGLAFGYRAWLNRPKIKCNISSSGKKIYHLPGDRLYKVTKVDTEKGEMWAHTQTEAMENGFQRSEVR